MVVVQGCMGAQQSGWLRLCLRLALPRRAALAALVLVALVVALPRQNLSCPARRVWQRDLMTVQPLPVPPIPETLLRLKGPADKVTWYQMRWKRGEYIGLALMHAPTAPNGQPILVCAAVQPSDVLEGAKAAGVVKDLRTVIDEAVVAVAEVRTCVDVEVTLEEIGEES
jgi:hypothetical protein